MISPWANERLLISEPTTEDAEIEALQTDVMRFMAILGFILSVIFALVQSIPFTPTNLHPTLKSYESLKRDIANLKNYIQSQITVLDRVQLQLRESETLKAKRIAEIKQLSEQRNRLFREAKLTDIEFKESQNNLKAIGDKIKNRKNSLHGLRLSVERERGKLQLTQEKFDRLKKQVLAIQQEPNEAAAEKDVAIPRAYETPSKKPKVDQIEAPTQEVVEIPLPPKQVGFTLKFESEEAFNRLLAKGLIKFYVFVGDKTWRVRLHKRVPKFLAGSKPRRYQEMDQVTVPTLYVTHFKRKFVSHGRNFETWGVVLPKSISRSIQTKILNKKGGEVVINSEGGVHLENSNP